MADSLSSPAAPASPLDSVGRMVRHPSFRSFAGLFGVAAAVAVGITIFFWSQTPAMVPLFSGLMPADEMAVIERLQQQNIPYSRNGGGGALLVPANEVHELRLALSAEGLPRGAGVGFELFQDTGTLGGSALMENARYQHALETELSRTIAALHPVHAARVHLALQRRSAFVRPQQDASAAVMLTLHPGRSLDNGQIASIVHLVSSSVPDLAAERVSVVDQRGQLLSRRSSGDGLDAEQLAYQERVEQRYIQRIRQLLLPLLGSDRISAQVNVDLDFSRTEQTREQFDPQSRTLRSEQSSEERRASAAVGGVPGALSNRPPNTNRDAEPAVAGGQNTSLQQTRNYEIDRTIEQSWNGPGSIRRISAAVVVDHMPGPVDAEGAATLLPLSAELMQQIEALVREAVGFSQERGDSVNVQNLRFAPPKLDEPISLPLWQQPEIRSMARQLLGLAVLLLIAFRLLRPAVKAVLNPVHMPALSAQPSSLAVEASDPEAKALGGNQEAAGGAPTPGLTAGAVPSANNLDGKLLIAREAASSDPKRVAQLVRSWISDE